MIELETVFTLSKSAKHTGGRTPIKDRGIRWEEAYSEKTVNLKKKFDKIIGPDSYIRYEGHDFTTDSDYYVVIGPTVKGRKDNDESKKMFFAGVKKLPPPSEREKGKSYSPYGEYFKSMKAAHAYASEKWGVPMKRGLPSYTSDHLQGIEIPQHIKG